MTEEQEKRFGPELVAWLNVELGKVIYLQDEYGEPIYEYASDVRMADTSHPDDVNEYARRKEDGCCGSKDWEVTYTDGRVFMIGFTYGH